MGDERFLARCERQHVPPPYGLCMCCLLWTGATNNAGYGHLKRRGKLITVHRYSYEINVGPIAKGMHVLHRCDVRLCVEPSHLYLGVNASNVADCIARDRRTPLKKLDAEQAIEVRLSKEPIAALARRFNLTEDQVRRLRRGGN